MLKIVAIMLGGVLSGYLLRNRRLGWVSCCITLAIWILLFLLGIVVGNNDEILNNLDTIGWQALILSCGVVLGSVVLSAVVYRYCFKGKDER